MQLKDQVLSWWKGREPREQQLLTVMLIVLALFILIKVIWLGLNEKQDSAQRDVDDKKALLAYMMTSGQKIKTLKAGGNRVYSARKSLLSIADLSANRVRIPTASKKRMKPIGTKGKQLSIEFEAIKFDQALGWISLISKDPTLRLENLTLSRRKESGMANLSTTLQRVTN